MSFEQGVDRYGHPLPLISGVALARTINASLSSSVEVTLNANTRLVRIYAFTQDVYFRWGTGAVTTSNFDQIVPAGQILDLPVPNQTDAGSKYTAFDVIERVSGAGMVAIEY